MIFFMNLNKGIKPEKKYPQLIKNEFLTKISRKHNYILIIINILNDKYGIYINFILPLNKTHLLPYLTARFQTSLYKVIFS